jgi:hypothetical protein
MALNEGRCNPVRELGRSDNAARVGKHDCMVSRHDAVAEGPSRT